LPAATSDEGNAHLTPVAVVEAIEKAEKLLMPMARFALRDDRAVEHLERREQGGGAVAKVVAPPLLVRVDRGARVKIATSMISLVSVLVSSSARSLRD